MEFRITYNSITKQFEIIEISRMLPIGYIETEITSEPRDQDNLTFIFNVGSDIKGRLTVIDNSTGDVVTRSNFTLKIDSKALQKLMINELKQTIEKL